MALENDHLFFTNKITSSKFLAFMVFKEKDLFIEIL